MKGKAMKKGALLGALALALALALSAAGWLMPGTASASGPAVIQNEDVTGATLVNPCNGDTVTITSGTFQIVVHETATSSGGYHLIVEGNAHGVKGVGTDGASYQAPGVFWTETNATPGAQVTTQVGVLNVIGGGDTPNFRSVGTLHLTVDGNGNVTAFIDHVTETCTT
jgi:hypothetical protein